MRKYRVYSLFLVLFFLCYHLNFYGCSKMKTYTEIHYWSNASDESLPLTLDINSEGRAILFIRTNIDNPALTETGEFRDILSEKQLDPLIEILETERFKALTVPEPAEPGEIIRSIKFKDENQIEFSKYVTGFENNPQIFIDAETIILDLIETIRVNPVHTISFQSININNRINKKEFIELDLSIVNSSLNKIRILNPKYWTENDISIEIAGKRNDIPDDERKMEHLQFLNVPASKIEDSNMKNEIIKHIDIFPGDSLDLKYLIKFDWLPGNYDIRISFSCYMWNNHGEDIGQIELVSEIISVEVIE